jgi:hypothetical protein
MRRRRLWALAVPIATLAAFGLSTPASAARAADQAHKTTVTPNHLAGHAKAAPDTTDFTIGSDTPVSVTDDCGGGCEIYVQDIGSNFAWINKGGSCPPTGGTCWEIEAPEGDCLTAEQNSHGDWNLYNEPCEDYATQLFTNPPASNGSTYGYWYNDYVSDYDGTGACVLFNTDNYYLYVETKSFCGSYDGGKAALWSLYI